MPAVPHTIGRVVNLRGEMESSPRRATRLKVLAHGQRRLWLRAESLAILVGTLWLYAQYGAGWLPFVLLFAIPDLSLLTGVVSRDAAAAVYNVAHSYVLGVGLQSLHRFR